MPIVHHPRQRLCRRPRGAKGVASVHSLRHRLRPRASRRSGSRCGARCGAWRRCLALRARRDAGRSHGPCFGDGMLSGFGYWCRNQTSVRSVTSLTRKGYGTGSRRHSDDWCRTFSQRRRGRRSGRRPLRWRCFLRRSNRRSRRRSQSAELIVIWKVSWRRGSRRPLANVWPDLNCSCARTRTLQYVLQQTYKLRSTLTHALSYPVPLPRASVAERKKPARKLIAIPFTRVRIITIVRRTHMLNISTPHKYYYYYYFSDETLMPRRKKK